MNHVLTIVAIFLIALTTTLITGKIIETNDPCKIINCPRTTGVWSKQAQWTDTTEQGLAVCICPKQPQYPKYVALERKY